MSIMGAIGNLMDAFDKNAGPDKKMDKAEMAKLLKAEIGAEKKEEADKIFTKLDMNKDGSIDFQEFVIFVASLAMCIREK